MQQALKIVFAGTPEISKITLEKILSSGFHVALVLTQMDRPAGRGKKLSMSPVKELALAHSIEVFQPLSFKQDPIAIEKIRALQPDILVVVAYGLILPQELIDIPKLGCVNIHVSLLPRWRGAAPIQRAIIAGDKKSGVTIMQMDAGLDTGAILIQQSVDIETHETSGSLHDKLANLGATMIIDYLTNYKNIKSIAQDNSLATYAHKIDKIEAQINFNEEAATIERKIRGFNPIPGCFTYLDNQRLLIWTAEIAQQTTTLPGGTIIQHKDGDILLACGNNSVLKVTKLQLAGRKAQIAKEFCQGYPNLDGKILTYS
jgi:methionyl-tRNA formyltransferase